MTATTAPAKVAFSVDTTDTRWAQANGTITGTRTDNGKTWHTVEVMVPAAEVEVMTVRATGAKLLRYSFAHPAKDMARLTICPATRVPETLRILEG